ncbi:MAG: ATP-grasp domain-containing protein [Treponema sp.]|nr:ATP-grasp domain-containing protein [Treponema sp.]
MLKNREILEEHGLIIPLCNKTLYEIVSDKYFFGNLCKENGIPVPAEYNENAVEFPCVIKPRKYFSGNGSVAESPEIIFSINDYNKFALHRNMQDYYIQEFIKGKSVYLLFYFSKDGSVYSYSQENIMQQSHGSSIIAAFSADYHKLSFTQDFVKMLIGIKYTGLIMIELRVNENNDIYMIEANPRLWGPSQLILDSNMNLWLCFINDWLDGCMLQKKEKYKTGIPYFWSGGIWSDSIDGNKIVFHSGYSEQNFFKDYWSLLSNDIYLRKDSLKIFYNEHDKEKGIEKLKSLYSNTSKHSNYQRIPDSLNKYLEAEVLQINSRYEQERVEYICSKIDVKEKYIMDIGSNTGYFSFEFLDRGASFITAYEGNKEHTDFMALSAKILGIENKIDIKNAYYAFTDTHTAEKKCDIILLLNVLHHLGDDYGDVSISMFHAKKIILRQLNTLAAKTIFAAFQLGFNWKGDRKKCLFDNGTKKEMIEYITNGIRDHYKIISIGIPQTRNDVVHYEDLNEINISRDDSLGEFLNRPLFILKSIK